MSRRPPSQSRRWRAIGLAIALVVSALTGSATAVLTATSAAAAAGPDAPNQLQVNLVTAPMTVDYQSAPRFSWATRDSRADESQSGYEVLVASNPSGLTPASAMWDSGKVTSQDPRAAYAGPALQAGTRYWWMVRTYDAEGNPGSWSAPAEFGTTLGSTWDNSQPVWAPQWTDYTIDATFTITQNAAGIFFRSDGTANGYLWQFRSDTNVLKTHVETNGKFTVLKQVNLGQLPQPVTLSANTAYTVKIQVSGSTITTSLNGQQIDVTTDTSRSSGSVGVRSGASESASFSSFVVTAANGTTLWQSQAGSSANDLPCTKPGTGAFIVPAAAFCVLPASNWAFLRGDVTISQTPIQSATVYATGLSTEPALQYVFRLSLNGSVLGVGPTRSSSPATTAEYSGWDVTSLLQPGTNTFGALAYTTSDYRFQLELVVQYADGTRQTWGSGANWQGMLGDGVYPNAGSIGTGYYAAPVEDLNAEAYPFGFDTNTFTGGWAPATVQTAITGLTGTPTAPVRLEPHTPTNITPLGAGHYLIDFGTTQVGGLSLSLSNGTAGRTVEIRSGEVLSSPTVVKYHLNTGNVYDDTWTLRAGSQTLQYWGYRVFRYVEVIGAPEALTYSNTAAVAIVYPDQPSQSSMSTSDSNLNQVWQFTKNSIEALNLTQYVDSPTRERQTHDEGDNYIHQVAQAAVDGDAALGRYSLDYTLKYLSATPSTGLTEYRLLAPVAALASWQQTGDASDLGYEYPMLQSMLLTQHIGSDGLVNMPVTELGGPTVGGVPTTLIDWPSSERDGFALSQKNPDGTTTSNTENTVVNAFAYAAYQAMGKIAAQLGNMSDAQNYNQIAASMQAGIQAKLYDAKTGAFFDGVGISHEAIQSSVYTVALGAASSDQAKTAAAYIMGRGMACSVYCAAFLLEALYVGGQPQAALDLMTAGDSTTLSTSGPGRTSWLNMIAQGAGSTMEAWDPAFKSNLTYSHPWSAAPAFIVPDYLFGVSPLTPGWSRILIHPQPGNLSSGSVQVPTARGVVSVSFSQSGTAFSTHVTVPTASTAEVALPGVAVGQSVLVDGQPQNTTAEGTVAVVFVGSGAHSVSTAP